MNEPLIIANLGSVAFALKTFCKQYSLGSNWQTNNQVAQLFFDLYRRNESSLLKLPGMSAIASPDVDKLNDFFEKHGRGRIWSIPLGPEDVGIASVTDLIAKWKYSASKKTITGVDYNQYEGFMLPRGTFSLIHYPGFGTFARIPTKTGELMHVGCPEVAIDSLETLSYHVLSALLNGGTELECEGELHVPNAVNLGKFSPDLSFLIGAYNGYWGISRVIQVAQFGVDKEGFRINDETMIAISLGIMMEDRNFVIRDSYVAFVLAPGCSFPIGMNLIPLSSFTPAEDDFDGKSWW